MIPLQRPFSKARAAARRSASGRGALTVVLTLTALVLLAMISFALLPGLLEEPRELKGYETHPAVGKKLPVLSLAPLTGTQGVPGEAVTLESVSGRVVVVNFWGTWCPPCRLEFPDIVRLYREFRDRPDFRLFAVSCGQGRNEDPEQLREATEAFLKREDYDIPTYTDPDQQTRLAVQRIARSFGYPTTLVLDRDGLIRGLWLGFRPDDSGEIEDLVRSLLVSGAAL